MKRSFLDTSHGQIHYVTEGTGEPVLLLHQSPRSIDEYAEVIPIISKKMRVIAMDNLGYGHSDKPSDQPLLLDYADTVIQLLDELKISKTSLVGHHTGAKIATVVAANYPERVDKLVLSGPGVLGSDMKEGIEDLFAQLWAVDEQGAYITNAWNFWKEHDPAMPKSLVNRIVLDHIQAGGVDGKTGPYGFIAVFRSEADKLLTKIQCPTLVVWGTNDLVTFGYPKENEEIVHNAIPKNTVKYIEGGTFAVINMMPEEFAQAVLEFLENPGI